MTSFCPSSRTSCSRCALPTSSTSVSIRALGPVPCASRPTIFPISSTSRPARHISARAGRWDQLLQGATEPPPWASPLHNGSHAAPPSHNGSHASDAAVAPSRNGVRIPPPPIPVMEREEEPEPTPSEDPSPAAPLLGGLSGGFFTDAFKAALSQAIDRSIESDDEAAPVIMAASERGTQRAFTRADLPPVPSAQEDMLGAALEASRTTLGRLMAIQKEVERAIERETLQVERLTFAVDKATKDEAYYRVLRVIQERGFSEAEE